MGDAGRGTNGLATMRPLSRVPCPPSRVPRPPSPIFMPGRHLPPDHSAGDERTLGGYMAVHSRPAAFEGSDGWSYSVDVATDDTPDDPRGPVGAFLLFLRWRRVGEPGVEGHLETGFVAHGATEAEARAAAGRMTLHAVKAELDALLGPHQQEQQSSRPWWEAMREEGEE